VILIGLGTGVHRTVSIDQLSWRYPDRIGRLLGLFDTAGTLGGVAASLVVVLATGSREWRLLFLAAAVTGLGFVGTTIARISHHSAAVSGTDSPGALALRPYLSVFNDRRFALFVGATLCFGFAYSGIVAFLSLYLTERGFTSATASLLYSGLFAASVVQVATGAPLGSARQLTTRGRTARARGRWPHRVGDKSLPLS